jgi:predicted RNase H-like HicB family nuclease
MPAPPALQTLIRSGGAGGFACVPDVPRLVPQAVSLATGDPLWCDDKDMSKVPSANRFSLVIEYYREVDGRWLADIPALPGVTAYGRTKKQATAAVQALALRLIADRLEHGEAVPGPMDVSFVAA